jgi:hypothetical protein
MYLLETADPPGDMKESATHASITPNADTSAAEACIFTEAARFSTPFAVRHFKQCHARQLVNFTKCNPRHIQSTHQVNPLSNICLLEDTTCKINIILQSRTTQIQ